MTFSADSQCPLGPQPSSSQSSLWLSSLLFLIKTPAPQARRFCYPQPKKPGPSCQECTAPEPGGRLMTLPTKKKWIKWPQIDNKLNADFEEVSDGNKYWLTSYCVPFLDDSELPVETQIHLISVSVRQRGLWGLELISTACMCTRTFACVKRMSKFSIYPSGNARVGSNFPILSPRFSEFVTSRFSQPWKFSCNQELRAERKSVRGLKAPLISLTSCLGTLWVCFQERDSVLFLYGLQWPSLEACLARERAWETGAAKMRLARSFWEGWELPCFYYVFLFPN